MSLTLAGATLGAAAIAGGTNLISGLMGQSASEKNLSFQKKNLDWQKHVQQRTWDREDTAVQRRMNDLRDAGLNPYMAAGQSANSGAIVSTQAPQQDYSYLNDYAKAAQTPANMIGSYLDTINALEQLKQQKLYTQYMTYQNTIAGANALDRGNTVYWNWARLADDQWSLPDFWKFPYNSEQFKNFKDTSYYWKQREAQLSNYKYGPLFNEAAWNNQTVQNQILQINRDFAVADKIEGYIMDSLNFGLGASNSARGWYNSYQDWQHWTPNYQNYSESYTRNKNGYTKSRNYY